MIHLLSDFAFGSSKELAFFLSLGHGRPHHVPSAYFLVLCCRHWGCDAILEEEDSKHLFSFSTKFKTQNELTLFFMEPKKRGFLITVELDLNNRNV